MSPMGHALMSGLRSQVCMDAVDMAGMFTLALSAAASGFPTIATISIVVTVAWIQGSGCRLGLMYLAHTPMR